MLITEWEIKLLFSFGELTLCCINYAVSSLITQIFSERKLFSFEIHFLECNSILILAFSCLHKKRKNQV